MRRVDIIVSLVVGEFAALLMIAISRNISLPVLIRPFLAWLPLVFPVFTLGVMLAGSVLGRYSLAVYQLAKFGLVGGLNFLIDLGTLNLLIFFFGIAGGFYANVFKAVAFLVAVVSSFLWNKFWTFRALSTEHTGKQFMEFFIVSAVGLAVNVGTFAILNDAIGSQAPLVRALTGQAGIDPQTWASISAGGAAVIGLAWNFVGYKFIVFRGPS